MASATSSDIPSDSRIHLPTTWADGGMSGSIYCGFRFKVDTDPEASIFNIAHYGAAIDLFDVADELEKHY